MLLLYLLQPQGGTKMEYRVALQGAAQAEADATPLARLLPYYPHSDWSAEDCTGPATGRR